MADESPLKFPTEFPVKIMGRDNDEFHAALADIFVRHIAPLESLKVTRQPSREGRFISVTVVFLAENRAQLDALYSELSGNEHVMMAL
jgi:uncharacterized protein